MTALNRRVPDLENTQTQLRTPILRKLYILSRVARLVTTTREQTETKSGGLAVCATNNSPSLEPPKTLWETGDGVRLGDQILCPPSHGTALGFPPPSPPPPSGVGLGRGLLYRQGIPLAITCFT